MLTDQSFFSKLQIVQEALAQNKTAEETFDSIRPLICDPDVRREFFKNLNQSDWVILLHKNGYFAAPPNPLKLSENRFQHPVWEESKYLARIANLAPNEVTDIFCNMNSENQSVISDMVDAALAMPAKFGSILTPIISKAAEREFLILCFDKAAELCIYLSENNENLSAEVLTKALFTPKIEVKSNDQNHWNQHYYKECLEKVVPIFAKQNGSKKFLLNLCGWLQIIIEASKCDPDLSFIWRPAIEDHRENNDYHFAGVMVGFVRDGFEMAIEKEKISLKDAIEIILQHPPPIYQRISIHLTSKFSNKEPDLVKKTILDRGLFRNYQYKHEYALLLEKSFNSLTIEEQFQWLAWIDNGPDEPGYNDFNQNLTGEQENNKIEYWKFQKLHWVRKHLNSDKKKYYDNLFDKFGDPLMPDLNVHFDVKFWGNETPITLESMQKLVFIDVVNKISSWIPLQSSMEGPNISALAKTFREYVASDMVAFSHEAKNLIGKPAIYIREYIEQMAHAVLLDTEVDVEGVLSLCTWVVSQQASTRTTPFQEHEGLVDINWQWTRDSISQLLKKLCEAKIDNMPKYTPNRFKKSIWNLIVNLIKDKAKTHLEPKINDEMPYCKDYLEEGINSSQGKAIEAGFAYARWIACENKLFDRSHENISKDFEEMPEIKGMIENILSSETTFAGSLAIVGFNVNLIYWIGLDWLKANAKRLFPLPGTEQSESLASSWAAWNTFLIWIKPHLQFFQFFQKQYSLASSYYAGRAVLGNRDSNPIFHFGEHLVTLYLRGNIPLDGMLSDFLTTVDAKARIHTIKCVGKLLGQHQTVSCENINNSQQLWESYWSRNGKGDVKEYPASWPFESWFLCEKFPLGWCLIQIEFYLQECSIEEFDDRILTKLAENVNVDVKKIFTILNITVRKSQPWQIAHFIEAAMIILEAALKSDEKTCVEAKNLIDYLGRIGYLDFGKLLTN